MFARAYGLGHKSYTYNPGSIMHIYVYYLYCCVPINLAFYAFQMPIYLPAITIYKYINYESKELY